MQSTFSQSATSSAIPHRSAQAIFGEQPLTEHLDEQQPHSSSQQPRSVSTVVPVRRRSCFRCHRHRRHSNPTSTIYSIKRFMGRRHNEVQSEEKIVQFESVNADQTWTRKSRVQIYGKVNQAESLVRIAGTMVVCDQDGRFSREVELKEGENTIEVEILEGTKNIIAAMQKAGVKRGRRFS